MNNSPEIILNGDKTLGIFAKEPIPGEVKTRLCPPLSSEEAASLYFVSLRETVQRLAAGPWQTVLFYSGRRDFFAKAFPHLTLVAQRGDGLGSRMANALAELLKGGSSRAVLAGSDCPDLPLEYVMSAFARLRDYGAVVAPAADGGYVLVGQSAIRPELFHDIPWSTSQVLRQTIHRAKTAHIPLAEIDGWEDIDDLDSLRRLIQRSPHCITATKARELLSRTDRETFRTCPPGT